jgi:thiamine transport system substrate-binding protein
MYPAVLPEAGLPTGFETLIQPETALLLPAAEAQAIAGPAIDTWRAALAQ